ncbi:HD family phosphohydrolase [Sulfuriferula nivalis]|uniref:HD family phosphohydrolase n=2 Tax=Sulfuriferula nivalis TaxID=2675298 RepID=A0A809RIZ8_9PROT|nr:HD family phosphohydrolase [Sulfuriferula nivalis]
MEHSFASSHFKIKNQQQIDDIRKLGLKRIRYDPAVSDVKPIPIEDSPPPPVITETWNAEEEAVLAEKQSRIEQLKSIQNNIARVEHSFVRSVDTVRNITRDIYSRPAEAYAETNTLINKMLSCMVDHSDILIHAMGNHLGNNIYFHSMNVTVLSLMLAKSLGFSNTDMQDLGMAAMLHDIGKHDIPHKILAKTEPLTKAEQTIVEQHSGLGAAAAKKMGLSNAASLAILLHHEYVDGSGYPRQLTGDKMTPISRVLSLVNAYDNLCNPANGSPGLTPAEALSRMFIKQRAKFDDEMLNAFIKGLGVYPPGSLVRLSNDLVGLVLCVNSSNPMKPDVLIYDADTPKNEAVILQLANEPEIKITKSLRVAELSHETVEYLNPRTHVTYGMDTKTKSNSY